MTNSADPDQTAPLGQAFLSKNLRKLREFGQMVRLAQVNCNTLNINLPTSSVVLGFFDTKVILWLMVSDIVPLIVQLNLKLSNENSEWC